jgi:hypothetical protein
MPGQPIEIATLLPFPVSLAVVRWRLEIQDNAHRRVNAAHLVKTQEPDALAESDRVDRCSLLGKHLRECARDFDLWPKASSPSRRGRRRYQPGRQRQLI